MTRRATGLLVAWCALLALGTGWTGARFQLSADLRSFMPEPRTEAQSLLLQNIGESPASRLLLVAIEGAQPAELARVSTQLAAALAGRDEFSFVANGAQEAAFPEDLLAYRFLLTDSFDAAPLSKDSLSAALMERVADLASPAASLVEELLPRDPTMETLKLAEHWRPREEPHRVNGAWFTADGRALLVAETRAAAFDPDAQAEAIDIIHAEFSRARAESRARLSITGSGYFSATIKARMQREAAMFGAAATIGLLALMWIAYRRVSYLLLAGLPLVTGGLAGLLVVGTLFESVHGITLAFGFTLIGVAQDYPVHLFSHLRHDRSPLDTARSLWKPLLTGVTSTCIAYLAFLASGVTGLAQLACLTVGGLAVAAACTRFLLPRIIVAPSAPVESTSTLLELDRRLARLPRMEWVVLPLLLLCAGGLTLAKGPFWQDDLSRLAPVPAEALRLDAELRGALPTPDLRHLLVVSGARVDEVLARLESLDAGLRSLVARDVIGGFEHAAQILPSASVQLRRRSALPAEEPLRTMLRDANQPAGFEDDVFEPFIADVQRARELPPLTLQALASSSLGARLGNQLLQRGGRWLAVVSFHAIRDPAALAKAFEGAGDLVFLDLKQASQELLAAQRAHILRCLAIAAAALVIVVVLALRKPRRALRVLSPMILTTVVIIAVLRASGVELTLFHLISLVLAAGLGLDYALFFEHSSTEERGQERTLHALLVCALSTLLVFALLIFSHAPVLQAIGVTVTIGVISNFFLSMVLSRGRAFR